MLNITQGIPMIDVQHDFSWPDHSMARKLNPIDKACDLFNRAEAAQHLAVAAKMEFKQHLIEYGISRKNVEEAIEKHNKAFEITSDVFRKKELDSDQILSFLNKSIAYGGTV